MRIWSDGMPYISRMLSNPARCIDCNSGICIRRKSRKHDKLLSLAMPKQYKSDVHAWLYHSSLSLGVVVSGDGCVRHRVSILMIKSASSTSKRSFSFWQVITLDIHARLPSSTIVRIYGATIVSKVRAFCELEHDWAMARHAWFDASWRARWVRCRMHPHCCSC